MARYEYGLSTRNGYTLDNYSSCVAFFYLPWGLLTDCWLCCLCCLQIKGSNISCILLLEKSGGKRIIVKLKRGFKLDNQISFFFCVCPVIVNTRKGIRRRSQLVQTLFCCQLRAFISVLLIFPSSLACSEGPSMFNLLSVPPSVL